jgi:hypothetical protein
MNDLLKRVFAGFLKTIKNEAHWQIAQEQEAASTHQIDIKFIPLQLKTVVVVDGEDGIAASIQEAVLDRILKGDRVPEDLGSMIRAKIMEGSH